MQNDEKIDEKRIEAMPGYGHTLARIHYFFPDHPHIINPHFFVWQFGDAAPYFPRLDHMLKFWLRNVEGAVAFVTVTHALLLKATEITYRDGIFTINGTPH